MEGTSFMICGKDNEKGKTGSRGIGEFYFFKVIKTEVKVIFVYYLESYLFIIYVFFM